ncbi:MAG: hypothetical protein ACRDL4_19490 [Thermoleophilaceae bacterium]
MTEDKHEGEWIKVPEDRIEDLDLPEDAAEDVKGGVVPAYKYDGGSLYLKHDSLLAQKIAPGAESMYWK